MIDVWGADHGGYVKRMQAAVQAVSGGKADLDVKIVQLVQLLRAGEPVKMSKRAGEFVTLREVVDEVGRDAVRFMMLYRKNDARARFRPRQGDRAVARQSGVLRPVRPCARPFGVPQCARGRSRPAGRAGRAGAIPGRRRRSSALDRPGRARADAQDRALSARWSKAPRPPTSRTELPFISMNWRANFMLSGTRAMTCHIYASLSRMIRQ